jgi:hypothetical protein
LKTLINFVLFLGLNNITELATTKMPNSWLLSTNVFTRSKNKKRDPYRRGASCCSS